MADYTEDLCTAGIATSSEPWSGRTPDRAFDGTSGTYTSGNIFHTITEYNWLQYDFGAGNEKIICKYTITAETGTYNPMAPFNYTFKGSNNGSDWTTLDTQTNATYLSGEKREFTFSNNIAYRYYKFDNILSNHSDSRNVMIGEIEMMARLLVDHNPTRPDDITGLYNKKQTNLRGQAKAGYVRPTIKQFFTSADWEAVPAAIVAKFGTAPAYWEGVCTSVDGVTMQGGTGSGFVWMDPAYGLSSTKACFIMQNTGGNNGQDLYLQQTDPGTLVGKTPIAYFTNITLGTYYIVLDIPGGYWYRYNTSGTLVQSWELEAIDSAKNLVLGWRDKTSLSVETALFDFDLDTYPAWVAEEFRRPLKMTNI